MRGHKEELDRPTRSVTAALEPWSGSKIPVRACPAVGSSSCKVSPYLSSNGSTAPRSNVRLLWRKHAGPMGPLVPAAMAMNNGWSMAVGSSAISVGTAAIMPRSQPAPIMQATQLPLTIWFLAFDLIGQAKTGISSLELNHHLGVNSDTAWLVPNKILRVMADREGAYYCGERSKSMSSTSAENRREAKEVSDRRARSPSCLTPGS